MQQCMGIKADGLQCSRHSRTVRDPEAPHLHFCATHWRTYDQRIERMHGRNPNANPHHVEGTCMCFDRQRWCGHPAIEGQLMCTRHHEEAELVRRRIQAAAERDRRVVDLLTEYRQREPQMTWRQVVDALFARDDWDTLRPDEWFTIGRRYLLQPAIRDPEFNELIHFVVYWRWRERGGNGPAPDLRDVQLLPQGPQQAPARTLGAIARDNQNVHTQAVSEQTNQGLEKLLDIRKQYTATMRAPDWFASKWLVRSFGHWTHVSRVVEDMYRWYVQPSCRTPNDFLYRRALEGLYLLIRNMPTEETKQELFRRAFEECWESVGMCCDGHISRLCNVLVGFDEAFAPPVPFGEILQSKMAAIASQDISTEEKIRQATTFFNEHAVPDADRAAWLDAF